MIETGLFLLMIGISIIFLVTTIRYREYFLFIPTFLFLVMGMWLMQGEVVGSVTHVYDGVTMINQTNYLIGNIENDVNTTFNIHTPWLGFAFVMAAIIMAFVAFLGLTDTTDNNPRKK